MNDDIIFFSSFDGNITDKRSSFKLSHDFDSIHCALLDFLTDSWELYHLGDGRKFIRRSAGILARIFVITGVLVFCPRSAPFMFVY